MKNRPPNFLAMDFNFDEKSKSSKLKQNQRYRKSRTQKCVDL